MEIALRGLGFQAPSGPSGGGDGFFGNLFEAFGSVAEELPQFVNSFTNTKPKPLAQQQIASPMVVPTIGVASSPAGMDYMPLIVLLLGALIIITAVKR